MALNITVQSYNGVVEFGLTACRRAVPDIADLADYLVDAAAELARAVAAVEPAAPVVTTPATVDKPATRARRPRLTVVEAALETPPPAPRRKRAAAA
jgi:diacylglycerol O-acyltransferase / wax synthase